MSEILMPGEATLGVIGGGQLGRMFVHAAQCLGFRTLVLDPDEASPAGAVAHEQICAGYLDPAGLEQMASRCAAITTEFENVPAQARSRRVAPAAAAVAICQDRVAEKAHFAASGVACAPYAVIASAADLQAVPDRVLPGILKTARFGYDGKGQMRVSNRAELAMAWGELNNVICVLEQMLPLALELSVISARGSDGVIVQFPVQQNLHIDGILAVTQVPAADVSEALQGQALSAAARITESMNYVGVLCVEFFLLQDGSLIVNEMAPRPHNSGHYTLDACDVSQFELQVRTLAGLPLQPPRLHSPTLMLNLLGDLWFDAEGTMRTPAWDALLALPGTHLHLYGKASPRSGRKMGHLTITAATTAQAGQVALKAAMILGLPV
jgi:5-(carboxyamino)imidazole ribonucleotide synthase